MFGKLIRCGLGYSSGHFQIRFLFWNKADGSYPHNTPWNGTHGKVALQTDPCEGLQGSSRGLAIEVILESATPGDGIIVYCHGRSNAEELYALPLLLSDRKEIDAFQQAGLSMMRVKGDNDNWKLPAPQLFAVYRHSLTFLQF